MSALTGGCRHYGYEHWRPGDRGGPTCAAGCDNRQPKAWMACTKEPKGPFHPCPKREEWTAAERNAAALEWKAALERTEKIMRLIPGTSHKESPEWGKSGEFDCPCCDGGKVRWARSSCNGHVHAACTTPDCFGVME